MLQELVNYAEWLKEDFKELFEGNLTEGLHIGIEFKKTQQGYAFTYKSRIFKRSEQPDRFLLDLRKREIISKALGNNKGIIDKVIFSNNPYAIFFKLYFTSSIDPNKVLNREEWESFVAKHHDNKNYKEVKKELLEKFIVPRLDDLFFCDKNNENKTQKNIMEYYRKILKEFMDDTTQEEMILVKEIKQYVHNNLKNELIQDNNFISLFIEEKDNKLKFESKFFDKEIRVNFLVDYQLLKNACDRYFSKMIFNVSKFNQKKNNKIYGLSNFFNKAAEEKKVFNFHKTAFFKPNKLIEIDWATILNEFLKIRANLPNPLPIFIDKNELNAKVVTIFKNDTKKSYKEIISELIKNYKSDIGNYYLINFTKTTINDFDYVPSFKFYLDEKYLINNLGIFDIQINEKIENIFDIETLLDGVFFFKVNRKTGRKGELLKTNYFSNEIDPQKGWEIPGLILNNLYKYRKTIYDAIYKSRLYLITPQIIKDICMTVIRYEISHDETDVKTKRSKNEKCIIEKMLKYFALNKIFDKENKNTGGIDMPSKLPEYYNNLKELLEKDESGKEENLKTFKTDEDFAFGLGQLIRYLLELSESSNKNHSMFNPFLQKLNNYGLFIEFLMKTFQTYSHKIKMHYRIFDKLISNILAYKPEKDLKDLEVIIMAGYFADSVIEKVIKELSKTDNENKKEDE